MKISIIFGTRPEAIKLAPIIIELKKNKIFECNVCVTAQHRQMLDQVLEVFNIIPDVDLNLMEPDQSLAGFCSKAIVEIDKYLEKEKPDIILVQGDTTSAFCASLVAFYQKVSIGHVEAGLRTGNILSPWPEEANRVLISHLANLHFAPTEANKKNLLNEGIEESKIFVTGNTVIDALFIAIEKIKREPPKIEGLPGENLRFLRGNKFILITVHRRESYGKGFENICYAIAELSDKFPDIHFIFPVHLNPKVQATVGKILGNIRKKRNNIHLISPQPYLSFVYLMYESSIIITDSGGIQEEAPSLGKPVLVLRDCTERPEGILTGVSKLIGTKKNKIIDEVSLLINNIKKSPFIQRMNPYGDGNASKRIVKIISDILLKK